MGVNPDESSLFSPAVPRIRSFTYFRRLVVT